MFSYGYKFNLVDRQNINGEFLIGNYKYRFSTLKRRYISIVEKYENDIFIIKYYADNHSQSAKKYSHVFNNEKPAPIIRTCIDIMLDIYKDCANASFGFMGSPSHNKKRKKKKISEGFVNTQRFRIYQGAMTNFFGTGTFTHSRNVQHSSYLMINKCKKPISKFIRDA